MQCAMLNGCSKCSVTDTPKSLTAISCTDPAPDVPSARTESRAELELNDASPASAERFYRGKSKRVSQ